MFATLIQSSIHKEHLQTKIRSFRGVRSQNQIWKKQRKVVIRFAISRHYQDPLALPGPLILPYYFSFNVQARTQSQETIMWPQDPTIGSPGSQIWRLAYEWPSWDLVNAKHGSMKVNMDLRFLGPRLAIHTPLKLLSHAQFFFLSFLFFFI